MQGDIVAQGVELMVFGMGTVVMFLSLLVIATGLMSRLVGRYFPEPEPLAVPLGVAGEAITAPMDDARLVAVISAAIRRHRYNTIRSSDK